MKDSQIKFDKIQRRGVESGYSMTTVIFDHPEEGLIVGERVAQELIRLMPQVVPASELDYQFFEGYRSKDGLPGFAIFGKVTGDIKPNRIQYLVRVVYHSADLADTTDIPERFFTGPVPKPNFLRYCIEAASVSPLCSRIATLEFKGLEKLLQNLQTNSQDLGLGIEFYNKFDGKFVPQNEVPASVNGQLQKTTELGSGKGRYLIMVISNREGNPQFQYGHFRGISEPNVISLTDKHKLGAHVDAYVDKRFPMFVKESPFYFEFEKVIAIFGKGMSPLYEAMKQ